MDILCTCRSCKKEGACRQMRERLRERGAMSGVTDEKNGQCPGCGDRFGRVV